MEILYDLGLSDADLKVILEQEPIIAYMENGEVNEKIELLRYIGCNDRQIRNIIVSNPSYLDRINDDILKLIAYLKQIGFDNINLLFDSNPYLLDKDSFEIKDYVDMRLEDGMELEDIVDSIGDNPYIIDED